MRLHEFARSAEVHSGFGAIVHLRLNCYSPGCFVSCRTEVSYRVVASPKRAADFDQTVMQQDRANVKPTEMSCHLVNLQFIWSKTCDCGTRGPPSEKNLQANVLEAAPRRAPILFMVCLRKVRAGGDFTKLRVLQKVGGAAPSLSLFNWAAIGETNLHFFDFAKTCFSFYYLSMELSAKLFRAVFNIEKWLLVVIVTSGTKWTVFTTRGPWRRSWPRDTPWCNTTTAARRACPSGSSFLARAPSLALHWRWSDCLSLHWVSVLSEVSLSCKWSSCLQGTSNAAPYS